MADDELIQQLDFSSRNWSGEEWSPDRTVEDFKLRGFAKRAAALDEFDNYLSTLDPTNLRSYSRLTSLRRDLDQLHHTLRKVGR